MFQPFTRRDTDFLELGWRRFGRRVRPWAATLAMTLAFQMIPARAVIAQSSQRPNVVIIFTDDQGYGDVGCFGAQGFETPRLDRMAREGARFTNFYVAQAVCGASRAALLTGCYPNRIGMLGAPDHTARHGLQEGERTLAQVLKDQGYATAAFGKWHLGHLPPFLPTKKGFDQYFGLPYSNDMWPLHPTHGDRYPPLPLIDGDAVVAHNPDQSQLTTWYTQHAVDFIAAHRDQPFFLYVAHNMPHVPLFVSEEHRGLTPQGLYGDVIAEIDWSVGRILDALQEHQLDEKTLVIFTSDNGPWLSYGNHAGSAGPLREGKGTAWEGGVREPCIMRWPQTIPAGLVVNQMAATIDVLPTIASLTGAPLPPRRIDGLDISALLRGDADASPRNEYWYYWGRELHAVRRGPWKLHFPHPYRSLLGEPGEDGLPGPYQYQQCGLELYDLDSDVGERQDVAAEHPEIVAQLKTLAEQAREDLGDALTKRQGTGVRPHAVTENAKSP